MLPVNYLSLRLHSSRECANNEHATVSINGEGTSVKLNRRALATTVAAVVAAVVASIGMAALPAQAAGPTPSIANDTVWNDDAGNPIRAQGGNVLHVGSTYYWVGVSFKDGPNKNVNLYSSTDLTTWHFDKTLLSQGVGVPGDTAGDLTPGNWLGRPQLAQNPNGTWVLDFEVPHLRADGEQRNAIAFATSPTIDGTYTYLGASLVDGNTTGDHSLFVDGANAYLVYVGDNGSLDNYWESIALLNPSWTAVQSIVYKDYNNPGNHHEAPAIIKIGSTYHWFASGMNWWAGTATGHRTSTNLTSWTPWANVATVPASGNSFNTQFEQIIPVIGSSGTSYLYNGDRYSEFYKGPGDTTAPGGIGRNDWYPLTFSGDTPTLIGATDVHVNAAAGTLDYNAVANGRFDQDVAGTAIPQWATSYTAGATKVEDTTGTSNRQLTQTFATSYSAWAVQQVTLPAGTYTFSADVKSSGGQSSAYLVVKNYGGAELHSDLSTAVPGWQTRTLTFTVSTGSATIGIWSAGSGGQWLNVDDVSIWRN